MPGRISPLTPRETAEMMQQGVDERAFGDSRAGVNRHPGGLVDRRQIVVLVKNFERDIFGESPQGLGGRGLDVDAIAWLRAAATAARRTRSPARARPESIPASRTRLVSGMFSARKRSRRLPASSAATSNCTSSLQHIPFRQRGSAAKRARKAAICGWRGNPVAQAMRRRPKHDRHYCAVELPWALRKAETDKIVCPALE